MEGCIFCMIGTGELVSKKVYEDEWVVAFDDIAPQAPVHTLIVPKAHYASMIADVPADLICALFSAVAEVARIKGVDKTGYRLIVNNGIDAKQTVQHLHLHIMGGRAMAHGMVRFEDE